MKKTLLICDGCGAEEEQIATSTRTHQESIQHILVEVWRGTAGKYAMPSEADLCPICCQVLEARVKNIFEHLPGSAA